MYMRKEFEILAYQEQVQQLFMHYIELLSELPGSRIANVESDFNLLARLH